MPGIFINHSNPTPYVSITRTLFSFQTKEGGFNGEWDENENLVGSHSLQSPWNC